MKFVVVVMILLVGNFGLGSINSKCYANSLDSRSNTLKGSQKEIQIENGFSPGAGAENLVLKMIDSAKSTIRLAAYSFTSPKIVYALLSAKQRGVDVQLVVDDKGNRSRSSISAINILLGADIPVRANDKYAIHHDKYMVVDEQHVQTGSFNYSQAAAKSNSENVLVVWFDRTLAKSYLMHWQSRFNQATKLKLSY